MNKTNIPVKIKLFDPDLPLPTYQSTLAAGFDLASRIDTEIPSHQVVLVPVGFALEIPDDFWLLMTARSSLHKKGLTLVNGVGVGDPDYKGDHDEYRLLLYNFSDQTVQIKKGDRLAQGILMPRYRAEFTQVTSLANNQDRGGIGSTGEN